MNNWINKLFVEHADIFLKIMNLRWPRAKEAASGMVRVLQNFGIMSGNLLDLCCGNGRLSICMALKGFRAVGVDISRSFIEDARKRAKEYGVANLTRFIEGDVRRVKDVLKDIQEPFDVVVNAWTSIGYFSPEEDINIFRQARELSKENAILFILETAHTEFFSAKFVPSGYVEIDDKLVLLENRKYDPLTSNLKTSWMFYIKRDKNLEFIDSVEFELHVYSLSELSDLLRMAGWEPIAAYGNISTLQPISPLTSLNLVAKAK